MGSWGRFPVDGGKAEELELTAVDRGVGQRETVAKHG